MEEYLSGFLGESSDDSDIASGLIDVEIISTSGTNIIARGKRLGRYWLLKGIIPELRESPLLRRALQKEFEIHSRLVHPNIVRVSSLEEIPSLGTCIVEEWVDGNTLADLLREGKLSKKDRRRILREIISAVGYMHSVGVIHRDLKPKNFMVRKEGGEVVLIDFGLADTGDYADFKQAAGSKGYMSPEQIKEGGARVSDDIYSLGVIMRELCPEYTLIANRCTGPVDRRPHDTESLLRMIDRTDRRPKLMAWGVGAALLAGAVVAGSLHLHSISTAMTDTQAQIDTLINSNDRNAETVERLEYLQYMAEGRLSTTEAALSTANVDRGTRRRAVIDAYRKIENEYITFDRQQIPRFTDPRSKTFIDTVRLLRERCEKIAWEAYDLKRFPELATTDSVIVVGEIRGLADQLFSIYYSAWQMQFEGRRLRDMRLQ